MRTLIVLAALWFGSPVLLMGATIVRVAFFPDAAEEQASSPAPTVTQERIDELLAD